MFRDKIQDLIQFVSTEAVIPSQANRLQPELRLEGLSAHVYVNRLLTIARIEEEPVGADPHRRRHQTT